MLGFAPLANNSIAGFGNVPVDTAVTGVVGTGDVGTVAIAAVVTVTGPSAGTASVGAVTSEGDANATVTGLLATGSVGSVLVWGQIVPSQTSNFSAITVSQTPSWTNIAA